MAEGPPSLTRRLGAIGLLPFAVTVVVPAIICLVAGTNVGWGLPGPPAAASVGAGAALVILGLRLMRETIALFSREGEGTLAPWDPTRRLVVVGPYRRVRNPMITGVFLVLSGETLISGAPQMALWTAGFAAVNALYMPLVEEPGLVRRFGDDYVTYREHVPRWIPRRRPWVPTFALVLLASLAVGSPAAAQSPDGVATEQLDQSPAEVRDYWTPERIREAVPLELPGGPAQASGSGYAPYAQPPDQETNPALDTVFPQRVHGLLLVTYGTTNASCSATLVNSRNRSAIMTAGHCVALPAVEGGGSPPVFASNVAFIPGYRNGAAPNSLYAAASARVPFGWITSGDLSYDVGAYTLAPTNGVRPQDALGALGVSFNRPLGTYSKRTAFQVFGYPAEPSAFYDGERLIQCGSKLQGFQSFFLSPVVRCSMKQGASGGAFVLKGGLVNSVVSHNACGSDPNCPFVAGTYFGNAAFSVWSKAGGGLSKGTKKKIKRCKRKPKQKRGKCLMRAKTFKQVPG